MIVTRVFKGPLRVGNRVTVSWEGWSEREGGPIVGGCRVPGTEAGEPYPYEVLVIADESLRVRNDSTSQRVGEANESLVRYIARLARR